MATWTQPLGETLRWRWQTSPTLRRVSGLLLAVVAGALIGALVVLATTAFNKPKLLLMAAAVPVGALLLFRWPEYTILLLVAITSNLVDRDVLPVIELGPMSLHTGDIVLGALLALIFLRACTQPNYRLFGSPLSLPMVLFFGTVVLSMFNGIVAFDVAPNAAIRVGRTLFQWLAFFPVLFLVRDRAALQRLVIGLFVLGIIFSLGIMLPRVFTPLHLMPVRDVTLDTAGQSYGSDVTRIYYTAERMLCVMIPAAIGALATLKPGRAPMVRLAMLSLAGSVFWLLRSFQRNYWAVTALAIVLLLGLLSGEERLRLIKRMAPLGVAALLLLGVAFVLQPHEMTRQIGIITDRVLSLTQDLGRTDSSIQWRLVENFYALKQIQRYPILGIGISNLYRPEMVEEWESRTYDMGWFMHNVYLWFLLTMGIVGLGAFLLLAFTYVFRIFAYRRHTRDDLMRGVSLGLGVGFIGAMISNVVAPNFMQNWALAIYAVGMGVCEVAFRLDRQAEQEQAS